LKQAPLSHGTLVPLLQATSGGAQPWTRLPDGWVTVTRVDGLAHPIATIRNYQNGSVDGDPADRDLITRTVYDKAGRRSQAIRPTV
jgi:hypothetical protein